MNGIMGMTELALATELTPEQSEYLDAVRISADALMNIINDILDFSKIEAKKIELEEIPFDLPDTLHQIVSTLAFEAQKKRLELALRISPNVPDKVIGDPGRIRQVLINLLSNAVKFSDNGEVLLEVTAEATEKTKSRLLFSVKDTGIGIPANKQSSIFDPFAQADGSTTRKYGGTGLGLAITAQLVKLMGGEITLESQPKQGSTFSFSIPMTHPTGLILSPRPVQLKELKGLQVMGVDDNETNRKILNELLRHWGLRPYIAKNGNEALEILQSARKENRPIRLALIDADMPVMDGFELAEQISQDGSFPELNLIMLTSVGLRGDASRCKALGISTFLTKPVNKSLLLDAILNTVGIAPEEKKDMPLVTRHSINRSHTLNILLVEDNRINQMMAHRILEKNQHNVFIANDGLEALDALEKQAFDLTLMDIQMPKMDGMQATAAIRENEKKQGKRMPIIAMTAHAMKGDREMCLNAGMDDYITKPIKVDELLRKIERLVSAV